jgi:hypothetical protein
MITKQEIKEHIEGYCKELRLPAIRQSFEEDVLFSILSALKTNNFNQNRGKGNYLSSFCNLI